jgi:hypothetical protein
MQGQQWGLLARNFLMVAAMLPTLAASADSARALEDAVTSSISVPTAHSASADPNQALSAFRVFTQTWMDGLRGTSALQTVAASSGGRILKRFSTAQTVEVKATDSATNPYVGILHYTEERYQCPDAADEDCTLVDSTPVTEIFRYQNGAWIY